MNKPEYEKVTTPIDSSFIIRKYEHSFFEAPLHIHPQLELITIERGEGLAFVGDAIRRFAPGDFMLVGKNVPHVWLSDDEYYNGKSSLISGSTYAQFGDEIIPAYSEFFPEFQSVHKLLARAKRGIIFRGQDMLDPQARFIKLPNQSNFDKLIGLYCVLEGLSHCEYEYLSTPQYAYTMSEYEQDPVLNIVYTVLHNQYQENITLSAVAQAANMNESTLCRYFKAKTNRTIFEYLIEVRISYATKLLSTKNLSIKNIAYDCGYNNLSLFNRQFKTVTGKSPSEYRQSSFNIANSK